jgi:protein phosphatase
MMTQYVSVYRQYCWPVQSLDDLKLAPFHLLTSEGAVHIDKNHLWHMDMLAKLEDQLIQHTAYQIVDLTDADSQATGVEWWMTLTGRGGEGMVVKPLDFITRGSRGILQPAIKCRGAIPAHHLRTRIHRARADRTIARARSQRQTIPCDAGIRFRC